MTNEFVDLLDVCRDEPRGSDELELVRISNSETAVIPFTRRSVPVSLHFCQESVINSYVRCNGTDCLLCRIGRSPTERLLVSVYLPVEKCVGVLPVSKQRRPKSLLPQLGRFLEGKISHVVWISQENQKFSVQGRPLEAGEDDGAEIIADFEAQLEKGEIDLPGLYLQLSDEELLEVEEIARNAKLKGLS